MTEKRLDNIGCAHALQGVKGLLAATGSNGLDQGLDITADELLGVSFVISLISDQILANEGELSKGGEV